MLLQFTSDTCRPPFSPASVTEVSPLFISTSVTVGVTYDPMPKSDLLKNIERDHDIARGEPFQGKLVIMQDQEGTTFLRIDHLNNQF